jgi:hypothetical protein
MSSEASHTINCKLNDFFNKDKRHGSGSCELSTDSASFIAIWNEYNIDFESKFKSLEPCFKKNGKTVPSDLRRNNTIWIDLLQNKATKGLGKKFLDILKTKALENGYKYVFLYPSKTLGGTGDQDKLISYYESVGFEKLDSCFSWLYGSSGRLEYINRYTYDDNAPYHLMFCEIRNLNTSIPIFDSAVINYMEKYLKYKNKYLELKKTTK